MPDICMQHLCAVMLLDGTVSFGSAHDEAACAIPGSSSCESASSSWGMTRSPGDARREGIVELS